MPGGLILGRMREADDVARRFIALWGDYLSALAADPKLAEPLHRWLGLVAAAMPGSPAREAGPAGSAPSPADATAAARPPAERDAAVPGRARRLDAPQNRGAALPLPRRPAPRTGPRAG